MKEPAFGPPCSLAHLGHASRQALAQPSPPLSHLTHQAPPPSRAGRRHKWVPAPTLLPQLLLWLGSPHRRQGCRPPGCMLGGVGDGPLRRRGAPARCTPAVAIVGNLGAHRGVSFTPKKHFGAVQYLASTSQSVQSHAMACRSVLLCCRNRPKGGQHYCLPCGRHTSGRRSSPCMHQGAHEVGSLTMMKRATCMVPGLWPGVMQLGVYRSCAQACLPAQPQHPSRCTPRPDAATPCATASRAACHTAPRLLCRTHHRRPDTSASLLSGVGGTEHAGAVRKATAPAAPAAPAGVVCGRQEGRSRLRQRQQGTHAVAVYH